MRLVRLVGALAVALLIALSAAPATAHAEDDYLIGSDPQPKQEMQDTPGWVTLAFRSKASAKLAKILVLNSTGNNVTSGALIVEGTNVTTQLQFDLPKGTYSVYYRTSDSTGQPRGGAFQFAYGRGEWTALDKEVWVGEAEQPPIMSNPDPNSSIPGIPTESATAGPTEPSPPTSPSPSGTASDATPGSSPSGSGQGPAGWLIGSGIAVAVLLAATTVVFVRRNRKPGAGSDAGDPD